MARDMKEKPHYENHLSVHFQFLCDIKWYPVELLNPHLLALQLQYSNILYCIRKKSKFDEICDETAKVRKRL